MEVKQSVFYCQDLKMHNEEAYLEISPTSKIGLFSPSWMFDWVLNTPWQLFNVNEMKHGKR